MTLREIIAANLDMFYAQSWYAGEAFMDAESTGPVIPKGVAPYRDIGAHTLAGCELPTAAALAAGYLLTPSGSVWRDYLWTADTDGAGQRVYVGGTANGHGFEVHRHLHLTERWGIPLW